MNDKVIPESLLVELSRFLSLHMALRFPPERRTDLARGIISAAREFGFQDAEECVKWLLEAPLSRQQVEILASHLTIGETYFFRDPKTFETLERTVLPPLISERRWDGKYLRIWCAGCATGEEPYTVAIILTRLISDLKEWKISILGTDINAAFLHKAKEGVYGEWSFRSISHGVKERYFTEIGTRHYRIASSIKECVEFSYLNLAEDAYPSLFNGTNGMDIIFCRNVLMYFSPEQQAGVVAKFYRCLVPEGLLVVSPAEMSPVIFGPFCDARLPGGAFYRKIGKPCPGPSVRMAYDLPSTASFEPVMQTSGEARTKPGDVRPPADLRATFREAAEMYGVGRYEEAEQKLEGAISLESDVDCDVAVLMAKVEANLGRLKRAREFCEKAITCDRLNPGLYVLLSTILQEMDLPEEQDAALKRALYLDQECVVAHFARGNLAARRDAPREAERHYENALAVLEKMGRDEVVPLSEGVTAGRMREVIMMAKSGKGQV